MRYLTSISGQVRNCMPKTFIVCKTVIKPKAFKYSYCGNFEPFMNKRNGHLTAFILSLEAELYHTFNWKKKNVFIQALCCFYQVKWSCEQSSKWVTCHWSFWKFLNISAFQCGHKRVMKPKANWQMDIILC